MKIGLSSAAYYGQLETDEAAAHIAELPLDTCEVFLETPSEYTTDFTFRMRYNMNNFPVTSVHPLGTQFEPQLFGRAARNQTMRLQCLRTSAVRQSRSARRTTSFTGRSACGGIFRPRISPSWKSVSTKCVSVRRVITCACCGERQLVQRRHAGGRAHPAQTHPGRGVRA